MTFRAKVYRWPDSKPLPEWHGPLTSMMLMHIGQAHDLTGLFRFRNGSRYCEVVQAFRGRRVAEVEIGDGVLRVAADSGRDVLSAAIADLVAALTPDALDIMHEAQIEPLPVYA